MKINYNIFNISNVLFVIGLILLIVGILTYFFIHQRWLEAGIYLIMGLLSWSLALVFLKSNYSDFLG